MKVILKETGEVVNVEHQNLGDRGSDIAFYCTELKRTISRGEFILEEKSIDWEERRWQLSCLMYEAFTDSVFKMALEAQAVGERMTFDSAKERAIRSIELADELIKQYKAIDK